MSRRKHPRDSLLKTSSYQAKHRPNAGDFHNGCLRLRGAIPPERRYPKGELSYDTALEIDILGERREAKVIAEPAYDPQNERLRA